MGVTRNYLIRHPWKNRAAGNVLTDQMHEGDLLDTDGTFHQNH